VGAGVADGADAGLEVVGTVPAGVLRPLDGGVDVEVEHDGEDACGEVGGQGDERRGARAADVRDGCSELAVKDVAGGSAGEAAGEQPGGAGRIASVQDGDADGVAGLAVSAEGSPRGRSTLPVRSAA
jgi:hypothetical protein